jgi:putative endonuclease
MPGATTSTFYVVYTLESQVESWRYIGFTTNLQRRFKQHQQGEVFSTKFYKPFKLIYAELCTNEEDARRRESYLKTTKGRRFLSKRLKSYYSNHRHAS